MDPDGRYDLETFKSDFLPFFNLDFGRDYASYARQSWDQGRYFAFVMYEIDVACEMLLDFFIAYEGAVFVGGIVDGVSVTTPLTTASVTATSSLIGKSVSAVGKIDIVYGPSANGALRNLADSLKTITLNDLSKPMSSNWIEFSKNTLLNIASKGGKILFDLTYMGDQNSINDILNSKGPYALKVTSQELRFIKDNWSILKNSVLFCRDNIIVEAPW